MKWGMKLMPLIGLKNNPKVSGILRKYKTEIKELVSEYGTDPMRKLLLRRGLSIQHQIILDYS